MLARSEDGDWPAILHTLVSARLSLSQQRLKSIPSHRSNEVPPPRLHRLCIDADLAPAHRFVRPRAGVGAVELLGAAWSAALVCG